MKGTAYGNALLMASATLAVKITVVHLLTVRERMVIGQPVRENDKANYLDTFFKYALIACPHPSFQLGGADFIERCERVGKNCAENEPFFLLVATVAGLTVTTTDTFGAPLISLYAASRVAHTAAYLLGDAVNASLRSVAYTASAFCTLAFSGSLIFRRVVID